MDFLLIVLLTLLNGVFAMSEMALSSSRKARLGAMAEAGDKGAQTALYLLEHPTQFLSTVQVGITSIGMLNGIVGEAAFSGGVGLWLQSLGMADKPANITATALVVTTITFITIIFGELVPKRIGQLHPEATARWLAPIMRGLATGASPFVKLLSSTTAGVLHLLRIDTKHTRSMTEEEISASLEEGVDAGLIEAHEHQMVQNVFQLDDRNLASLMRPRSDVEWLDASNTVAESLDQVGAMGEKDGHSWYPVCRGSLDEVVGIISVTRLLELGLHSSDNIGTYATPPTYVPETLTGMELLEQFRAKANRLVFVVDEYGVLQGIMTPLDLLEAITGELHSEQNGDTWATLQPDGYWALAGLMPVAELKSRLAIDQLPDEGRGRYNTVAGLLMAVSGHLPVVGERVECGEWWFEIVSLDGRRIDKVLAWRVTQPALMDNP
jgi:putative hemolysin